MSLLFSYILSQLLIYRYVVLFFIAFLDSFGLPVLVGPSTIAAAAFANQGYFSLFWVMIFGSAGSIGGDFALYWLVSRYGRKVLVKLHLSKLADSPILFNAEATVETYKAATIIASRFQAQATAAVNIIAGLGKMKFKNFAWLVCLGEILQMAFYVIIGYFFADSWQTIYGLVGQFSWIIALALAIALIVVSTKIAQRKFR